jgi:hypothetical protein
MASLQETTLMERAKNLAALPPPNPRLPKSLTKF